MQYIYIINLLRTIFTVTLWPNVFSAPLAMALLDIHTLIDDGKLRR